MPKEEPLKNKRIFVGFNSAGTAGIYSFTRSLKRRGVKIDFYGLKSIRFEMPVDFLLEFSSNKFISFSQRTAYFFKILPQYDIWHLNFMEAFFFYPLNLFLLKIFGKKIVVTFRGAEVRTNLDFLPKEIYQKLPASAWPEYYQRIYQFGGWKNWQKRWRVKIFIWFADQVVLTGPFLAGQVSRFEAIIPYAREIGRIGRLEKLAKRNKKLTILHLPSEPVVKGTSEIEKIFKKLKKIYPKVDFKILSPRTHLETIEEMAKADIVIDQILVGWYGGQAVEALAMGKIVMAYLSPTYLNFVSFGGEIPIWNTNFWTFEQDLRLLLKILPRIKSEWGRAAVEFAKKYHSHSAIANQYLEIYRQALRGRRQ